MVAIGTLISAFWILSANSWMHTPTGLRPERRRAIRRGRLAEGDLQSVVSLSPRSHGAGGVSHDLARRRRGRRLPSDARSASPGAARHVLDGDVDGDHRRADPNLAGDQHGLNTLEHQPAKVMAMEGHYDSHPKGAPLILFGLPDQTNARSNIKSKYPAVIADPEALARRAAGRARYGATRELAAGADCLLVVPHHGRLGAADDDARRIQRAATLARRDVSFARFASIRFGDGSGRISSPCLRGG